MPKGRANENERVPRGEPSLETASPRARMGLLIVALVVAGAAVIAADYVFGVLFGSSGSATPSATASAAMQPTSLRSGLVLLLPR